LHASKRELAGKIRKERTPDMNCRRCLKRESRQRAVTDLMDIAVCNTCAEDARKLGITVQPLAPNRSAPKDARDGLLSVPISIGAGAKMG
jgi:hypothetical protein